MRRAIIMTLGLLVACAPGPIEEEEPQKLIGAPNTQAPPAPETPERPKATPKRAGALWYRIEQRGRHLDISLRLLGPPQRTSFFLPGPWAGQTNHANHLSIQGARTPNGPLPVTLRREERRIDLETRQAPWVELRYRVTLQRRRGVEERFAPQRFGQGFFAYAPTFLVLPSAGLSNQMEQIPVEIHAPATQHVLTTWQRTLHRPARQNPKRRVHGFVVQDIQELRDAFVAVTDEIEVLRPGANLRVAFDKRFQGDRAKLTSTLQAILRSYRERFGDVGPITALVRSPGKRSKRMLWGTGRRQGFVLELRPRAAIDDSTKILMAHEAFHLWNGHLLVPRPQDEVKTRWFKEGGTHYIALQTLLTLGLVTEQRVLQELAGAATRYARNPARLGRAASGLQRQQLPYDRGVLLGVALETRLRAKKTRGIDAWLRILLTRAREQPGWMYDERALKRALDGVAQDPTLRTFWSRSVERAGAIDLTRLFAATGLHWLPPTSRRPGKLIALEDHPPLYRSILRALPRSPARNP